MRTVTPEYMQSLFARETTVATIVLLTIDHPSLDAPIRVSSDAVDTVSRLETFIAYPFALKLPDDEEDTQARASLSIDNVGRGIIAALRGATGAPPTVLIEIVKSTNWDEVEATITGFVLGNAKYDVLTISGELIFDTRLNEACPAGSFTPGFFPNAF